MPTSRCERAFTLVEMLLGLGIFSLVSLTLAGMLWGGIRLEASARAMMRGSYDVSKAMRLIARDLENAVKLDLNKVPSFKGGKNELSLLTQGARGIVWVTYRVGALEAGVRYITRIGRRVKSPSEISVGGSEQGLLLLREEVLFKDLWHGRRDSAVVEVLLAGVYPEDLVFGYGVLPPAGAAAGTAGQVVQDSWAGPGLPAAVRVILRVKNLLTLARTVYLPEEYQVSATVDRQGASAGVTRHILRVRHLDSVKDIFVGQ